MPRKRPERKRETDFVVLAQLYLTRHSQKEIGELMGVSQQQVSKDLAELQRRWLVAQLLNFDQARKIELARIDALEQEAWEAYRRTIGQKRRRVVTTSAAEEDESGAADDDAEEIKETTWEDAGDPRFLEKVAWCIDKRCKILGLDAPTKTENVSNLPISREEMRQQAMLGAAANRVRAMTSAASQN